MHCFLTKSWSTESHGPGCCPGACMESQKDQGRTIPILLCCPDFLTMIPSRGLEVLEATSSPVCPAPVRLGTGKSGLRRGNIGWIAPTNGIDERDNVLDSYGWSSVFKFVASSRSALKVTTLRILRVSGQKRHSKTFLGSLSFWLSIWFDLRSNDIPKHAKFYLATADPRKASKNRPMSSEVCGASNSGWTSKIRTVRAVRVRAPSPEQWVFFCGAVRRFEARGPLKPN